MDQLVKLGPLAALSKLWDDLTSAQRAVVVAFTSLAIVVVVMVAVMASKPKMAVLFSNLEPEDAGAIVQKLDEEKVQYKLTGSGNTIEVPSDKVYDLRIKLSSQGLPQGGNVGLEVFDKTNFGMTEFTEKLQYQRAIQGELTRTICQLAPVMDARVMIAIPEDKVFESEQQPPKASVYVKLRRGMPLTDEQVAGIVHLVSQSVPGLKTENVAVVDSNGNTLSDGSSPNGNLSASQSKMKRQTESELAQNLQSMLARIVGTDKAVVRVSAKMNFDQVQSKSETYQPAIARQNPSGIITNEETTTEDYNGKVIPPGTVPAATSPASAGDTYKRTQSTRSYEVSKEIKEVVTSPGTIDRLCVAVLVDDTVDAGKLGAIREAVSAAAGIDVKRGDQITVQRVAFDTASKKEMDAELANASRLELIKTLSTNAGAVVLLIIFLIFLRKIVRQIKVQAPTSATLVHVPVGGRPAGLTSLSQEMSEPPIPIPNDIPEPVPSISMPAMMQTPPSTGAPTSIPIPEIAMPQVPGMSNSTREELPPEVSQSTPEELAKLVRSWMSER